MGGKASNVDSNELKMYNGGSLVRDSKNGNSPSRDLNNYNDVLDLKADGIVGADTGLYVNGGEVIRQLGNGSNVYFETKKHRLNDNKYGKEKYILNIGDKEGIYPKENIYFNNLKEALSIAEKIERDFPNGVPDAILLDKVIENYKKESPVEPMNEKINKKEKSFESEGSTEGKGKLYEFFTPQIIADKMLALAQHYGFKGGKVLEPATGNGRLIKNLKDTDITAFEISKDNFEILKREFPNAELYNFNFEKAFLKEPRFNTLLNRKGTETWLKNAPFDLVLSNPPYGKFSGLYSSYFNFKGQVEHFFILQTLYLLKKGGLGVYLIPSSFMRNGIAYNEIKKQIFEIAELVDAYRLPSDIFEKTQIGTDILILRKK
jgi:type I restriction-modification system DNA methylase subunit